MSLLFLLLGNNTSSVAAEIPQAVVVSFGPHNTEPFAIIEGNELMAGIIKDIADELADLLDVDLVYSQTSRKRVERYLATGQVHLVLTANPKWYEKSDKYRWSDAIFSDQDVLVVRKDYSAPLFMLEDMSGMQVGTVRGYVYPSLTSLFEEELITRSDVRSLESNIGRLKLERIDSFIDSKIIVQYQFKQRLIGDLKITALAISEHQIHAALSVHAPISLEALNRALKQLKEQGVIEAILLKYSNPNEQY